jgi:hypothetical protein
VIVVSINKLHFAVPLVHHNYALKLEIEGQKRRRLHRSYVLGTGLSLQITVIVADSDVAQSERDREQNDEKLLLGF